MDKTTEQTCTLNSCSVCGLSTAYKTSGFYFKFEQSILDLHPEIEQIEYLVCWPCTLYALGIKLQRDMRIRDRLGFKLTINPAVPAAAPALPPNVSISYPTVFSHPCARCHRQIMPPAVFCSFCSGDTTG